MGYTQDAIWGVSLTFPLLGLIFVGIRFWMRLKMQKTKIGVDDWLILFASILVIGMGVDLIIGSYIGMMGMDGQPIDEARKPAQSKIDYAMLVFEKPAYGAIKLSVLFFYRRIFTVQKFRLINNWLIALIVTWTLAFWLADLLNCGAHPEANWNPTVKKQVHCINLFMMLLIFAITDVLTDIAIMWMPYPYIKRLHMDAKERWALAGIFLLGSLDLLIGCVRLGFIVANQTIPAVNNHFNAPESTAPAFWTVIEVGIGVIAANLPALAPLFKQRSQLIHSLSSYRDRLLSKASSNAKSRNDSFIMAEKGASSSLEDIVSGALAAPPSNTSSATAVQPPQHQASPKDSVGIWDQFDRVDNMSAEELGTPRSVARDWSPRQ